MAIQIDGDSGVSGVNGSATTPALQGTDSNTGIVFGTDEVQIATGGSTRATVDSSGNFGIGTSSPAGQLTVASRFDLQNSDSTNDRTIFAFGTNNLEIETRNSTGIIFKTNQSESMRIASNGRVGIGTSSALARTHLDGTDNNVDNVLFLTAANLANGAGGRVSFGGNYDGTNRTSWADIKGSKENATSGEYGGYLSFSTRPNGGSNTERMRITSGGTVAINRGTGIFDNINLGKLQVYNNVADYYAAAFHNDGNNANRNGIYIACGQDAGSGKLIQFADGNGSALGNISFSGSTTAYNTTSDYRLKENVVDLDGAIARVKQLLPKRFNFIVNAETTVDGFLAHEAATVVPEAVTGTHNQVQVWGESEELPEGVSVGDNKLDEEGNTIPEYQGIDQSKLVPLLTAALQEAISKIETLETKVAALEAA